MQSDEDINEEELLLSYLENIHSVTVVAYLLECINFIGEWEWSHEKYKEIQEERLKDGENSPILTEEEINKYGFTDEEIEELNSYADIDGDEYKAAEEQYNIEKEFCRLIRESTDIQTNLLNIVKRLEYDDTSEELIVTCIYTLAGMIKLGNILDNGQDTEPNEEWQEIKKQIAEQMEELTTKDFLCVLELAGANILLTTEEYQEVVAEKISKMTEFEFITYLLDTEICEKNQCIKEVEKQKLEISNSALAQFYVDNDVDANTVLRLLEGTRSFDKVEVLESIVDFEDERVAQKAYAMVKNLTTEQIVKYFITSQSDKTDSKISEILIERLKDLSDEDIKTLACFYRYEPDEEFQNEVLNSAKQRGICEELDDIEENDVMNKRISAIKESADAINELPILILSVRWEYIGQIDKDKEDHINWILDDYQKHKENQKKYEELWKYISDLSNISVKELEKIIVKVNNQIKILNEKSEETLSEKEINDKKIEDHENAIDDEETEFYNDFEDNETKEEVAVRVGEEILRALERYLKNRILEAEEEDEKAIKLLGLMFLDESEPFHIVVQEKLRQMKTRKKGTTGDDENSGGRE